MEALLACADGDWPMVHALIAVGQLAETIYAGHWFYLRRLGGPTAAPSTCASACAAAYVSTRLV